jgi:hypothetical protein
VFSDIKRDVEKVKTDFVKFHGVTSYSISNEDLARHIDQEVTTYAVNNQKNDRKRLHTREGFSSSKSLMINLISPEKSSSSQIEQEVSSTTFVNPFATIWKRAKDKVKVQYNSYTINRLCRNKNNFETALISSLASDYRQMFLEKFLGREIDNSISVFRDFVTTAFLSQMLYPERFSEQERSLSLDELNRSMISEINNCKSVPEDIVDRMRKYVDQFSDEYSSSLDKFSVEPIKGPTALLHFWRGTLKLESFCGNTFFELSSKLLKMGIAVWTPDPTTPGDYIISCCFGFEFKETIHIISHSDSLHVKETEVQTR